MNTPHNQLLREMLLTPLHFNINPLNHNKACPINSISNTQRQNDYKTEDGHGLRQKEMQESLRIIRQNIQALKVRKT